MKTALKWFETLSEPYKSRAIAASAKERGLGCLRGYLEDAIMSFGWRKENEAHGYPFINWAQIGKGQTDKPFYHKYLRPVKEEVGAKVKKHT